MPDRDIAGMRAAHKVLAEYAFEPVELERGYANRTLRIDIGSNAIETRPVTQEMKDLWIGGKGFDLWLTFQEINKDTKWDSPENPICMSPGPLGGTTSFPGSGKTLVTAISPITQSMIDCNVGGYFGPFLKFAGFDALMLIGKATSDVIVFIDAIEGKITIEEAPKESIDSHIVAEELTEMYAVDDFDRRNISVVSAGTAAEHTRMGVLNFSFWDWRRGVARLKQAGRGGVGTVLRDKMVKALVIRNRHVTPSWRIEESPAAAEYKLSDNCTTCSGLTAQDVKRIVAEYNGDPEYVVEMMQDIQDRERCISKTSIDTISLATGVPKARLYHIVTFFDSFTLEPRDVTATGADGPAVIVASDKHEPVVLRNSGKIDPESIEQYGGYASLRKVLESKDPDGLIKSVIASGLRGRGGGGFPTGLKWEAARKSADGGDAYVICNAEGGGAGAFSDRTLVESDPHAIIEGLIIGAAAIGAKQGIVYLRQEYTLAQARLSKALADARAAGMLGDDILGSGMSFDIAIRRGAGAFVCGESSALIDALEGKAGEPQATYTHHSEQGYKGKPTVLNNVETWANVPVIVEKGAEWYASIGTADAKGTTVLSLVGDVVNKGLVEVPLGTTLREVVCEIGGGVEGGELKAVMVGGPTGGILPASLLDTPLTYEALLEAGSMLGSGVIQVINDGNCVVEIARGFTEWLEGESCGKCTPCREGLAAMRKALTRICTGEGKMSDLEFLAEVSDTMVETSLCQLGGTAPNPVLSTLRYFREEYEQCINNGKCDGGNCNCTEVK
ncbi:MAG: hypothetical protein GY835_11115 [bacterium]|nr:hypothetical protein [bacterium]